MSVFVCEWVSVCVKEIITFLSFENDERSICVLRVLTIYSPYKLCLTCDFLYLFFFFF